MWQNEPETRTKRLEEASMHKIVHAHKCTKLFEGGIPTNSLGVQKQQLQYL